MPLVSMKLPPRDKTSEEKMYPTMADSGDGPKYPWGLCITLEKEQLDKLGLSENPKTDTVFTITAKAEVTSVSANQTQEGERRSITLQITDLALSPSSDSDESDEAGE
jgi:hypothetical protein